MKKKFLKHILPGVLFITLLFVLSGCMSGASVKTRYYVLNPVAPESGEAIPKNSTDNISLEIISLRLPQYLERPQIVTRSHQNQLQLSEYHQWAGNLRKNVTIVLARNLSRFLKTPNVIVPPQSTRIQPDFRVQLEIMQFEMDAEGTVQFSGQWRLWSRDQKTAPVTQIVELARAIELKGGDYAGIVQAMEEVLGEVSLLIADVIATQN
ncbi:PqiC family protein [Desulfobacterales bacterium HSG17]|nr:PqiC family protein [Desulfobacterales bacterium HSG17]